MKIPHADFEMPWDELNHTELVWLATYNGIPDVSRGVPRDDIIRALREVRTIPGAKDPFKRRKGRLSSWLKKWWDKIGLEQQNPPAKHCPECVLCPDAKIAWCWMHNHEQIT